MTRYAVRPTSHLIWLPLPIATSVRDFTRVGLWLSALNVRFRGR